MRHRPNPRCRVRLSVAWRRPRTCYRYLSSLPVLAQVLCLNICRIQSTCQHDCTAISKRYLMQQMFTPQPSAHHCQHTSRLLNGRALGPRAQGGVGGWVQSQARDLEEPQVAAAGDGRDGAREGRKGRGGMDLR